MSLTYIMGAPATGKTKFCVDKILELDALNQEKILFIVPEQFSLSAEKMLVNKQGAIINTQILSFNRLAFFIFSELGGANRILLEDIGKNILLRKILSQSKLIFFNNSQRKSGFVESLNTLISEFYKYETGINDLDMCINYLSDDLKNKVIDIKTIYKKYDMYIKKKYLSNDDILDVTAEKISQSKYLHGIKIFIDGFTGFNLQEYRVISELMKIGDIFFTATIDQEYEINYFNFKSTDPYYEIKSTINNLSALAKENRMKINQPISLKKIYKKSHELKFLIKKYFSLRPQIYSQTNQDIFLYESDNIHGEIDFVAKKIISFVKNNMRFRDIAIISGDVDEYADHIKRIFELYSIPYFIDKKISIMGNIIVEFIRAAFNMIIQNFSHESVFRFLRTNLFDIEQDDIDLIEEYVLEFGIKNKLWHSDWHFGFDTNKYDKDKINKTKELVLEKIDFISDNLVLNHKYKTDYLCRFIFEMINHFNIEEKLNNNAEENSKVWNKICGILDKIYDILGNSETTLKEFNKIFDESLKKTDLGLIPEFNDQVIIGNVERTRLPDIKVMFVIGANDGYLPKTDPKINLLTQEEKKYLNSMGLKFELDFNQKIIKDNFDIYSLLSKPSEKLIMTRSLKNKSGGKTNPSPVFDKIKKIFVDNNKQNIEDKKKDETITLPKVMFNNIANIICAKNKTTDDLEIYNWFRHSPEYKNKISRLENLIYKKSEKKNNAHKIIRLDNKISVSVSQLESYAQCPFAYFLKYDLKLSEKKICELKPIDIGSFMHTVLKNFFTRFKDDSQYSLKDQKSLFELKKNIEHHILATIKESDFNKDIFYKLFYNRFLLNQIKDILVISVSEIIENITDEGYYPDKFEFTFSNINLTDNIYLNGRIDRIDIFQNGNEKYMRVIDYKSREKTISEKKIDSGLNLQLLIYLKSLMNLRPDLKPGGAFYFYLNKPIIDLQDETDEFKKKFDDKFKLLGTKSDKLNNWLERAETSAKNIGEQILCGNINIDPHDEDSCVYCPYKSICQKKCEGYAD